MKIKHVTIGAIAIAATVGALTLGGSANAATPTDLPGNATIISSAPRLAPFPGVNVAANTTTNVQIAGQTFGSVTVPSNATGVELTVATTSSNTTGDLTFWTKGNGKPGTASLHFDQGVPTTSVVMVPLSSDGAMSVWSNVAVRYAAVLNAYYTPVDVPAAPVIKTIAPVNAVLAHIGPSVRTDNTTPGSGVTDLGSVELAAGTYDVRVIGGFSGLKSSTDVPATTNLFGGLFITNGAGIPAGFGNVLAQSQGVEIPKTNSGSSSYTVDPTVQVNTYITLTEDTTVHVQAYAYSSDGSARGSADADPSGETANIASAQFVKIA